MRKVPWLKIAVFRLAFGHHSFERFTLSDRIKRLDKCGFFHESAYKPNTDAAGRQGDKAV